MIKEKVEELEQIAFRVPPGDNWELKIDRENIQNGLVTALTTYVRKTKFKGDFRLSPLDGKLYAIIEKEIEKEEPKPVFFDLYGEEQTV